VLQHQGTCVCQERGWHRAFGTVKYLVAVDFVGVTEIGQMLGVSRQRADQLTKSEGFPAPMGEIRAGRIWRREDIETWARETKRLD
jgi:prophage regulatory protein